MVYSHSQNKSVKVSTGCLHLNVEPNKVLYLTYLLVITEPRRGENFSGSQGSVGHPTTDLKIKNTKDNEYQRFAKLLFIKVNIFLFIFSFALTMNMPCKCVSSGTFHVYCHCDGLSTNIMAFCFCVSRCNMFFIKQTLDNICCLIHNYLIALPVLFVWVSFCILLRIINACVMRPCPFSQ